MKKWFSALAAAAALVLPSSAVVAQKSASSPSSLLWKITGPGLKKPSYLFGTIHMICADDYFWTTAMSHSQKACEVVCLEMDLDDPALQMKVAQGMMNTDGKTLRDYFTPDQYKRLERYVRDSLGQSMMMYQMMKPVVLVQMFSMGGEKSGCSDTKSYEMEIMRAASDADQPVMGLETPEEQLKLLNSLPEDSVVAMIMAQVDGTAQGSEAGTTMDSLVAAYKRQDLPALEVLMAGSSEMGMDMGDFLDDRNARWISRMRPMMKRRPTFFAVGAGHLGGKSGVIQLLREAGFTLTPVRE